METIISNVFQFLVFVKMLAFRELVLHLSCLHFDSHQTDFFTQHHRNRVLLIGLTYNSSFLAPIFEQNTSKTLAGFPSFQQNAIFWKQIFTHPHRTNFDFPSLFSSLYVFLAQPIVHILYNNVSLVRIWRLLQQRFIGAHARVFLCFPALFFGAM